jgi:high-affinity iron transporter
MKAAAAAVALMAALSSPMARAQDAALAVHLLDYIAVDYGAAVADGRVKSAEEYAEMTEFAAKLEATVAGLPGAKENKALAGAVALRELVAKKSPAPQVAGACARLRQEIVGLYRVPVGPKRAPDLKRAQALFAEHCAACHGASGLGDGPLAKGMEPAPANFHESERARVRSIHGLYSTITRGVAGTAMRPFAELSDEDRWALAYLAAGWGADADEVARGRALWEAGKLREEFPTQAALAGRSLEEVEKAAGVSGAALAAYLRTQPALIEQGKPGPFEVARERLAESASLYARGDAQGATRAALSAYLDGFELTEAALRLVDEDLVRAIEAAMIEYRNAIKEGLPAAQVASLARAIGAQLETAEQRVQDTGLSDGASFLASFVILLREGLEAVLVVVALAAFLRRGNQAHALPYLHAGWIGALLLGGLTWYVATRMIAASGASRELTEGVSGLLAAAMLLYVGFWLHDKSHSQAWRGFLMRGAQQIGTGAAWGFAFMAFIAVYREVFETVLFYETLWAQAPGRGAAIGAGFAAAVGALAMITWAILRFSLRLPLGLFFGVSGLLLAALAVVLAGNGIAALQEAGVMPITPVAFPTIGWLGIHPSAQALGLQALVAAVTIALVFISQKRRRLS